MKHLSKHNLKALPSVLFVRIPVMVPLILLVKLGERAEQAAQWVNRHTMGFR